MAHKIYGQNVVVISGGGDNKLAALVNGSPTEITADDLAGATKLIDYAFFFSTLTSITIPNSVKSIGHFAFKGCNLLTSVIISNSVTKIGDSAFNTCAKLTSITIPSAVTKIGSSALTIGSSKNKATITMLSTTPPTIQSNTFDTSKLQKIIVPAGTGATYKAATNWSNFADYIAEAKLATPVVSISGSIINWEFVPNASGYLISYSGTASGTQSVSAGTSSYDLEGLLSAAGTYTVTVTAKGSGDYTDSDPSNAVTYTVQEQLATPQNVTANGTTVSWDEVENATSYEILADGVSIGTVQNGTGYTVTLICQNGNAGFDYSIDNMSADLYIAKGETKNIIVTEYLFIKAYGMTPEVVSYSGGTLETSGSYGEWIFTPTQNNATITVVDND